MKIWFLWGIDCSICPNGSGGGGREGHVRIRFLWGLECLNGSGRIWGRREGPIVPIGQSYTGSPA